MTQTIPYELILPSASRPHLLRPVLESLLANVDQLPQRVIVHDDSAFPGKQEEVHAVVAEASAAYGLPYHFGLDNPPIFHGPTIKWLLDRVTTEYVVYSQDDHVVVRPIPVREGLRILHEHAFHYVQWNKRTTATQTDYPSKKALTIDGLPFVINPHWRFQTSLWRVARIRPVVDYLHGLNTLREHCESKINHCMNGGYPGFDAYPTPDPSVSMVGDVREQFQRTLIWGRHGEPQFVKHIGDKPEDWALPRNREGSQVRAAFPQESVAPKGGTA